MEKLKERLFAGFFAVFATGSMILLMYAMTNWDFVLTELKDSKTFASLCIFAFVFGTVYILRLVRLWR